MGFTGKLAIHPRQIAPIERVFTPTADEIERANRIIAENQVQQEAGVGVFVLDGKMMDAPDVRAAEIVLARARAAGIAVD
jgi:citrate lyase beta subunit